MVYKGIYLPSLSGKLQDERLELAYQKYAHRQRQKSLMLVNSADLLLKVIILLKVLCYIDVDEYKFDSDDPEVDPVRQTCFLVKPAHLMSLVAWLASAVVMNLVLGLISWWRCYANNFLHWGALATWLLLLVQGEC